MSLLQAMLDVRPCEECSQGVQFCWTLDIQICYRTFLCYNKRFAFTGCRFNCYSFKSGLGLDVVYVILLYVSQTSMSLQTLYLLLRIHWRKFRFESIIKVKTKQYLQRILTTCRTTNVVLPIAFVCCPCYQHRAQQIFMLQKQETVSTLISTT